MIERLLAASNAGYRCAYARLQLILLRAELHDAELNLLIARNAASVLPERIREIRTEIAMLERGE